MRSFVLSAEAFQDIDEIWEFIAGDNPDAADRMRDQLFEAFRKLARRPLMGRFRPELTSRQVRFWPVNPYLVIYDARVQPIEVVRVVHGARDLGRLLRRETRTPSA